MAHYLGIDLGTTYTAAAIERDGLVEALTLGNRTASVPSVVFLRDDGEILVGEAATRRATSEPGRVGREFKRRVGDPTPLILGGTPYAAEMLMARLLRWSVDRVREQQGADPLGIALTHPANWGPYKLDLLQQAVRQVDVDVDLMLPEPVAAATFYAAQRRLDPQAVVAVYDLGGGTFDAAMVRRTAHGFEIIGSPEGIERLGGIDFDEAVHAHVREAIGDALDQLDPEEPASVAAMARLRQECIDAKEALSGDTDVSIPVLLPNLQTEVRLTRSEFEDMIRPAISETIVALRRSIRSADVEDDGINAVLLVGGSSRIPLVAQMVGAELGRPIAIDAHPKDAISFGAAIAVAQKKGQATPESVTTLLPRDTRPPPPTMAPGTHRPAPPRPAPPVGARPSPPAARPSPPTATPSGVPVARPAPPAAARPSPPGARPGPPVNRPVPPAATPPAARPSPPATPAVGAGAGAPAMRQPPPASPSPNPGARPVAPAARPTNPTSRPVAPADQTMQRGAAPPTAARPAMGAAPAAHRSGPSNPAVRAPVPQAGPGMRSATPSGGWPAQRAHGGGQGGGGDDNRTALLVAIAVVAAVLVLILILLASQGGGDDDDANGNESPGSTEIAEGYTEEVEASFIASCTGAGETEGVCRCVLDAVEESVPIDDAVAWVDDPEAYPDMQAAIDSCNTDA